MNHKFKKKEIELFAHASRFVNCNAKQLQDIERICFFNIRLGEFLLKKRTRLMHLKGEGFNQQSIADKVGVSSDTLRRYERGESGMTAKTLFQLLDALELSFSDLGDNFEWGEKKA